MTRVTAALLALLLAAACSAPEAPRVQARTSSAGTVCAPPSGEPKAETATTIDVIEQAYFCILGNYYGGTALDTRPLLTAAFAALTGELDRTGKDLPQAAMPPLTGDHKADWAAFEQTYRDITGRVPDLQDELAVVTMEGMVAALGDNHARWARGNRRHPDHYDGDAYGLGLVASDLGAPEAAVPPLFVTAVEGGAAEAAGLRPGDVIEEIDGTPPFVAGQAVPAAIEALYPRYPQARPVRLRIRRETTGRRWSVTLKPGLYPRDFAALRTVQGKLLGDDVAYVRLRGFTPDAANRVFRAISRLRSGRELTGIVLDLRGNGGGSPVEATRLMSAFVHGKVTAYQCTAEGTCEAAWTDDTVELLGLPLVVLIDRGCASACEHFSSAAKDLRAGLLVGTRTAGVISGPARPYQLRDNTILSLPSRHHLGPRREVIDKVGVAPDHHVRPTPEDAAAGRDPALAKALTLLRK